MKPLFFANLSLVILLKIALQRFKSIQSLFYTMNPVLCFRKFVWFFLVLFPLFASAITIAPQTIPNVNGYTNDSTPVLTMTLDGNTGDTNMSFSCASTFTATVPFSSSYEQFSLTDASAGCSQSDGSRTISIRVIDSLQATATGAFSAITLDTIAPTISGQLPINGTHTANNRIPIEFDFLDSGSGIVGQDSNVSLKINGVFKTLFFGSGHASYTPDSNLADGTIFLQVDANDLVGNHSTTTWSFEVDTNAVLTAIMIDGNRAFTNSLDANMTILGNSDLNACHFKTTGAYGSWQAISGIMTITLETVDGNKTIIGQCKDEVDNLTEERSDIIGLDTLVPGTPAIVVVSIFNNQVNLHWTGVTDNGISGMKEYELFKNGSSIASHLDLNTLDYNVTGLSSGTLYAFRIVARDNAGNEAYSEQTATTSGSDQNQSSDTVSPSISWINPSNNAVIWGTTTLRVQVSDNRALKEVNFYLDNSGSGNLLGWVPLSGTSGQPSLNWNPSNVSSGTHSLIAIVSDLSNNTSQASRPITIDVNENPDQNQDQNQGQDQNQELFFSFGLSFKTNVLSRQIPLLNALESKLDFSAKRIVFEGEVQFTRKIDVFQITQQGIIIRYKNVFTLEAKNLLPQKIKRLDIIEQLPKEWVPDPSKLRFDHNYQVLEADPIVQMSLDNLDANQTAVLSYYFETDSNQNPVTQDSFQQLVPPLGLITLESGDACFNVSCNDSNPCTIDYCEEGNCKTAAKPNGVSCGENMACQEAICVSSLPPVPQTDWSFLWIGGGIIAGLIALLMIGSYATQKVKKMQKTAKAKPAKTPPSDEELKRMLQQSLEGQRIIPKQEMPTQAPEAIQSLEQPVQQPSTLEPLLRQQPPREETISEQSTQEQPVPETPSSQSATESEVEAAIQELKKAQSLSEEKPTEKKPKKSANSDSVGSLLKDALQEEQKKKPKKG